MRPAARAAAVLSTAWVWGLGLATAPAARSQELVLRRAELTQAGVGSFEYEARVTGAATLGLDLSRDQVSDALRSLVVRDGAGSVRSVTVPGESGAEAALAELPVPREALTRPFDLLRALRGVPVTVVGATPLSGRLLGAEVEPAATPAPGGEAGAGRPPRTRVTLLGTAGLQQFVLEDVAAVQVADPDLRAKLAAALEQMRGTAAGERRHLSIRLDGAGERTVRVGMVLPTPLWKAAYRLVLPGPGEDHARLQGWAILENAGVADWSDVAIVLQVGNLVAFHQDVYATYPVARPELPVDLVAHAAGAVDQGTVAVVGSVSGASANTPAQMAALAPAMGRSFAVAAAPAMAPPTEAAAAGGSAVAATFALPEPLSLAAGDTAAKPFIDTLLPARPVGLLRHLARHPLAAVAVSNDAGTALPPGAVTTLRADAEGGGFAGDARLAAFPAGERRMLSFAEDPAVTAEWEQGAATTITGVSAARGVLRVSRRERRTTTVTLASVATAPIHLVVEVPREAGTTLATEPAGLQVDSAPSTWRIDFDVASGPPVRLRAHADRVVDESTTVGADAGPLLALLHETGLPQAVRAALEPVAALATAAAARDVELSRLDDRRNALLAEEQRIRENLGAVAANDTLRGRLLRNLEGAEDDLARLAGQAADARAAAETAHDALAAAIARLDF